MYIYSTQSELYVVSFNYSWKNTITDNMYLITNTLLVYMIQSAPSYATVQEYNET